MATSTLIDDEYCQGDFDGNNEIVRITALWVTAGVWSPSDEHY